MRICITTEGNTLDSQIDPRFGRSRYFLFVDTETLEFEAIENPFGYFRKQVGINSADLIVEKNVQALITGNIGSRPSRIFSKANIVVYENMIGFARDAVESFRDKDVA